MQILGRRVVAKQSTAALRGSWFLWLHTGFVRSVGLTLRTELRGGSGAEADAARRSPHESRRAAGGVPP